MSVVVALLFITTTLKIDTFSAGLCKNKNKTEAQKSQWSQRYILSDITPEKSWWTAFSNCCFHPVNSRKQYLGCCHYKWECLTRGRLTRKYSPWKQTKFRNNAFNCSPKKSVSIKWEVIVLYCTTFQYSPLEEDTTGVPAKLTPSCFGLLDEIYVSSVLLARDIRHLFISSPDNKPSLQCLWYILYHISYHISYTLNFTDFTEIYSNLYLYQNAWLINNQIFFIIYHDDISYTL